MTDLHPDLRDRRPDALEPPSSALAIGAHPDDVEFGAGGTLAKWAAGGTTVHLLVVTDGSKGTWDPGVEPTRLAALRADEQRAAAVALGAEGVAFLGHIDGELETSMALREQIARHIREVRPEMILGHDPWKRYQLHPDHRAAGFGVVEGVVAARDGTFFPDHSSAGLEPHRPAALLLWSPDEANHWEEIGETLDRKIEALLCHASQGLTTMGDAHRSDEQRREFIDRIRRRAAEVGAPVGFEAAESFRRITP